MGNNFKFYTESRIDGNATFTFGGGVPDLPKYLYDNNDDTRLVSSTSSDASPVSFQIDFASPQTFDTVFIGYHNFKIFSVTYSTGGGYVNFSPAISTSTNTANYNYYEVTEVTGVTSIQIVAGATITPNETKKLGQFRVMSSLGEVSANPYNMENPFPEKSFIHEKSDSGSDYVQFGRKIDITIDFDDATNADVSLFRTIKDRYAPSYVYPCGGLATIEQEPFRVQDMYLVNYINPFSPRLRQGFLIGAGTEISLQLKEV